MVRARRCRASSAPGSRPGRSPLGGRHDLVRVSVDGLEEALRACPAPLSTMGRGLDEDLAYFLAAAAAGRHAGRLALRAPWRSALLERRR